MSVLEPEEMLSAAPDLARQLLAPPVLYLPIRHHSPACAIHVQAAILEHSPAFVLVEGPPSFDEHIDLLLDPDAKMPLAIYAHASLKASEVNESNADGESPEPYRVGSYFPLCDYSPELVALRTGRDVGATLRFIDLDHVDMAAIDGSMAGHANEQKMLFSDVLARTAAELGCRDHNELWDQMVEGVNNPIEDHVAAVLTYGQLARFGATGADLAASGTTQREHAMAKLIADAVNESDGKPVVVVTGAYHTVALPELVAHALAGTLPELKEASDITVVDSGHGLIRYSFDRLDALAGYSAGMANPRWYQLEWERRSGAIDPDPASKIISEVARALQAIGKDGQPSLPTQVDASVAVQQLHRLRGREAPTRLDVVDAMVSCFIKGEDTFHGDVRMEAHRSMTGHSLGVVPPGTPRVPLAKDFDRVAKSLGVLLETSEVKQLNLDVYRSERDRLRSRFLHGLTALGVHFGTCISPLRFSRTQGRDLVRERWTIQISGALDVTLTEASLWGASITEAVSGKTLDELCVLLDAQPSSAMLMRFVRVAAERGVHEVATRALEEMRARIGVDPSLPDVVAALTEAELLWVGREPLGGGALNALPDLVEQLYTRACQLGGRIHETTDAEWGAIVTALASIHRLLLTNTWDQLDHQLFWNMLALQRDEVPAGLLTGAIAGLEWRGAIQSDEHLLAALNGHVGIGASVEVSAGFLEGLILVARDAIWSLDGAIASISHLIERADSKQFLKQVSAFRSAFASLTPVETDRVAEAVMAHLGENIQVRMADISAAAMIRNTNVSVELEDRLRSDGFGNWLDGDADD